MLLLLLSLVSLSGPGVSEDVAHALAQRHHPGCDAIYALGDDAVVRDALIEAADLQSPPGPACAP